MKKNQRTYLLLALVLGVWGLIAYRVFGVINPNPTKPEQLVVSNNFKPQGLKERDTFSIVADYRDPFLGTAPVAKKTKTSTIKTLKMEAPTKSISFTGFVADPNSKNNIFFVTIEGQQYMMGIKEVIQDVELLSGNKDQDQGKTQ